MSATGPRKQALALCGSLRRQSRSLTLLQAAQALAPGALQVNLYSSLGDLPLFNPDLEANAPAPVHAFWNAVAQADVLLIASPEYAHGVTGVIKNALDWLGPVHTHFTRCVADQKGHAQGAKRSRGRPPARVRNAAQGLFGRNPKGMGGKARLSLLHSSPRRPAWASSCA